MTGVVEIAGFEAIPEFDGYNDDCGPNAEEVVLARLQRRRPSGVNMNAIRARDITRGWFTSGGGNTLHDIFLDATEIAHVQVTETPLWSPVAVIRDHLVTALQRGDPCILNVALASNLHGNEHGVHYHFVACGGINTTQADFLVLVANGDQVPFSGVTWLPWSDIVSAQPIGLLEFHMPTAPAPQPTPAPTPAAGEYVVKAGDTLGKIAAATLGNANRWQEIATLNHLANPNLIFPGQVLKLPPVSAPTPVPTAPQIHVVVAGDTLEKIAAAYYHNSARWTDIYNNPANRAEIGPNPDRIVAGQKLIIP